MRFIINGKRLNLSFGTQEKFLFGFGTVPWSSDDKANIVRVAIKNAGDNVDTQNQWNVVPILQRVCEFESFEAKYEKKYLQ